MLPENIQVPETRDRGEMNNGTSIGEALVMKAVMEWRGGVHSKTEVEVWTR